MGAVLAVGCGSTATTDAGAGGGPVATVPPEAMAEPPPPSAGTGTDDEAPSDAPGTSGPGAAGADPCAVLAGIDLVALVGEPVEEAKGSEDVIGDTCRVDPSSGSSAGLRVVVSEQQPQDNFDKQRDVLGVDTEATGIGDRAFHTGPYLIVLDGDRLVMIQVIRDSGAGFGVPDADLETAMRTILDNLAA